MHAVKASGLAILICFAAVAGWSQTVSPTADLDQARAALAAAEAAGAQTYAPSLYADAAYRIRFAQENWSGKLKNQAQMRAIEGLLAARAATAKARWLSTTAAIRTLQADITRFGGTSNVTLTDEPAALEINRGTTTKDRIATAQAAIDQARNAGALTTVADNELQTASDVLGSARKVSRGRDSETADHLAYRAEMIGRRAYYLARLAEVTRVLPDIQLQRTRLAQSASEQQAAAERVQREEAERRAAALQAQLAAEQANRQAQAAELDRLRQQIDESRRIAQEHRAADRAARLDAERRADEAFRNYENAIASASSNASDIENARRAYEDAEIALRAAQERERLGIESMDTEVTRLRNDLDAARAANSMSPQVLSERQADLISRQQELEQARHDRQDFVTRRADIDRQQQASINAAIAARQQREAQAVALQQQAQAAQQQAQAAQQQAAQAAQAAQQAQQAAQQAQAQLEQQRKEAADLAAKNQAELDKARQEIAQRDAEARKLQMENELARIAATRREQRGLVVSLSSGVFFDTGKSELKRGAQATLSRIATQLKTDPNVKVTVEGHTDSTGTTEKNQVLSEKRAEAVRDFLVNAGLPADRVTAVGKGESSPIATNKTAAGRQQNRRVELVINE